MSDIIDIVDNLKKKQDIDLDSLRAVLDTDDKDDISYLYSTARREADEHYGRDIRIRGLIEFTNYCRNDCYYRGIRRSNLNARRHRLTKEDIVGCADSGYELGFRTFVLQGGEDYHYDDGLMCDIVGEIHARHPDCAITLSIGERSRESYEAYFDAGAERYLLRHETADRSHYEKLHPQEMSYDNRFRCLRELRDIGYQVGCGFMVGSPYQDTECIYEDLAFIRDFKPDMAGIGPFISHKDTPFSGFDSGSLDMTLKLLSVIRLIHPGILLPATTALGTIDPRGRELGILAGANVIMPNLSPVNVRDKYLLYDGKICTGEEAAECIACLRRRIESIGYRIVVSK